jgi:hypothetical protein
VYTGDDWIDLPGISIAMLDTVLSERTPGSITASQLQWLDDRAATADRPVMVVGHHQQWISGKRHSEYFGLDPDSSDDLAEVVARRPRILAYTAGHTHRHRVRRMSAMCRRSSRLRQGLSRHVGRVPRLRRWRHPDRAPHLVTGGIGLERALPSSDVGLRGRLRGVRDGQVGGPVFQHPAAVRAAFEDAAATLLTTIERVEPHQWELPGLGVWTGANWQRTRCAGSPPSSGTSLHSRPSIG